MSVLTFPHQLELEPAQLKPFRGLHVEVDDNDPSQALLEIPDFNTLRTLEHLMARVVETSPDTLSEIEEQKATKLKNTFKADMDATLDGEHEDGPYRHKVEVEEANVVFHVIALKIEQEKEKREAMLKHEKVPIEKYEWLYDRNAPGPVMVAAGARHDVRDKDSIEKSLAA